MTRPSLEHALLDCIMDQDGSAPPASPALCDALWRALRQAGWMRSRVELASEPVPDQADESASALERLADEQDIRRLAEALEAMCNPLKQQVILLALDGESGPEIARALGLQETYVRVLKHRAVLKLRAHLTGDDS
jgi:RNA polymerase sigma factor (sigma-70 family)